MARGIASGSHLLRIRAASAIAVVGLIAVSVSTPSAAARRLAPGARSPGSHGRGARSRAAARSNQFQCAMVPVPLDWDKPNGTKIELAVIRHLASRPQQRIGSMFVNPGGPGQSGYDLVANPYRARTSTSGVRDASTWWAGIRGARIAAHRWSASPARPPRTGSGPGCLFLSRRPSRRPTSARRSSWPAAAVR